MIGEVPTFSGAVHVTDTDPGPAIALTSVGASGTPSGTVGGHGRDEALAESVGEGVAELDAEESIVGIALGVGGTDAVGVLSGTVCVSATAVRFDEVGVAEAATLGATDALGVDDDVPLGEVEGVADEELVGVPVTEPLGDAEGETLGEPVGEADDDPLALAEEVGDGGQIAFAEFSA